jgi:hypothetical protein
VSAAPHLLQRLRRWWHLRLLHTREAQQSALVAQMEQEIDERLADLACQHRNLRNTQAQLAAATHLSTTAHQPFTWGL